MSTWACTLNLANPRRVFANATRYQISFSGWGSLKLKLEIKVWLGKKPVLLLPFLADYRENTASSCRMQISETPGGASFR